MNILVSLASNRESLTSIFDRLLTWTHMTLIRLIKTDKYSLCPQEQGIFYSGNYFSHICRALFPEEFKYKKQGIPNNYQLAFYLYHWCVQQHNNNPSGLCMPIFNQIIKINPNVIKFSEIHFRNKKCSNSTMHSFSIEVARRLRNQTLHFIFLLKDRSFRG